MVVNCRSQNWFGVRRGFGEGGGKVGVFVKKNKKTESYYKHADVHDK